MNSRSMLMVSLLNVSIASSATSTVGGTAVDLANYFPVGKREIKFVIGMVLSSTSSTITANITLQECDSTATASFTNILAYDGSTLTVTPTADTNYLTAFHGVVGKRYVRVLYNSGQATTGVTVALQVAAFPLVRAA